MTEFADFLADILVNFMGDQIIAGDFNIHVNDLFNDDVQKGSFKCNGNEFG